MKYQTYDIVKFKTKEGIELKGSVIYENLRLFPWFKKEYYILVYYENGDKEYIDVLERDLTLIARIGNYMRLSECCKKAYYNLYINKNKCVGACKK